VVEGVDALDLPFEVKEGVPSLRGTVMLSPKSAALSGLLQTPQGLSASDFVIILFTTERAFWIRGARRVRSIRPASDGRFVLEGLPAGEYFLAAMTDVEPDDLADPDFLAQVAGSAITVSLSDGEQRTQNIKIAK
jgi:hypothetical protein